jgi:hypothetical protein
MLIKIEGYSFNTLIRKDILIDSKINMFIFNEMLDSLKI